MALTKEQIFGVDDLPTQTVSVPEWNGDVTIRQLTVGQREEIAQAAKQQKPGVGALMVVLSVVDEQGKPLFTKQDMAKLQSKSYAAVDRIVEAVLKHNGMKGDEAIDEAEKN